MNPQTATMSQIRKVPLEITCDKTQIDNAVAAAIASETPAIVAEFMATQGVPIPRSPTEVTITKPNGALVVKVSATYLNGQVYEGTSSHYSFSVALFSALNKAFYTPQSGPGLPETKDYIEGEHSSGHGV